MDLLTGLALAGAQGGNNFINYKLQQQSNVKSRQFAREMYQRELDDKQTLWKIANAYNHPLQQMQRLREAGLNPNLIYGKGADNTAPMIQGASPKGATDIAPRIQEGNLINKFMAYRQTKQATDNLAKQGELIEQEKLLKAAQTYETLTKGDTGKFDLEMKRETKDLLIKELQVSNDLKEQNLTINWNRDKREQIQTEISKLSFNLEQDKFDLSKRKTEQDIKESAERIANMMQDWWLKESQITGQDIANEIADIKKQRDQLALDIEKEAKRLIEEEGVHPDSPAMVKYLQYKWMVFHEEAREGKKIWTPKSTFTKPYSMDNFPRTGYFDTTRANK